MKRRRTKYNHKFERFVLNNRWNTPFYRRSCDWVIFGIGIRFFSPTEYEYFFNFIGLEFRWWFKREVKNER